MITLYCDNKVYSVYLKTHLNYIARTRQYFYMSNGLEKQKGQLNNKPVQLHETHNESGSVDDIEYVCLQ